MIHGEKFFGRLVSRRADFTVCVQQSFSKDGEALQKFLEFDVVFIQLLISKSEPAHNGQPVASQLLMVMLMELIC